MSKLEQTHPTSLAAQDAPVALPTRPPLDLLLVLTRWLLGACFLYTGLGKALDPAEFLKLVRQYNLVENALLLNTIAAILPWFEVFCGLLLLAGVGVRGTALALVLTLVPLTVAIMQRAWTIQGTAGLPFCAIKFDCGCGTGESFVCQKLALNGLLIFLLSCLLTARNGRLCLRYGWRSRAI